MGLLSHFGNIEQALPAVLIVMIILKHRIAQADQ